MSAQEDVDYVGHKFDLIRSIGYALYKIQYSSRFYSTKTPIISFADLKKYYLAEPNAITQRKVLRLLELFNDPINFNQRDHSIKRLKQDLDRYKDTFARVSSSVIGIYTHVLEELTMLTSLILDKDLSVSHESKVDDWHRSDLSIEVDVNFRTKFGKLLKQKYGFDLKGIDTINIDFIDSDPDRRLSIRNIKGKFFKNYQSEKSLLFVVLTHHKLYDKTRATSYIKSFDPYLAALSPSYHPEHIQLITMDEHVSFFGVKDISTKITPLTDLKDIRRLKDEALSRNPDISDKAFEVLFDLYRKAKDTLALIKNDPASAASILRTNQLSIVNFLGDPSKKIDYFL